MAVRFDEIDLSYWNDNKEKLGASKSYVCIHNGYTYGDAMNWKRIEFIHRTGESEEILTGENDGPKGAYFALVEKACNLSPETFENFKNNGAEKFRIYSKAQVAAMSQTKRNSTRIKDDSCKIIISGEEYYVANNLKICEYFNSAAINIESTDLTNWLIRIYFDSESLRSMIDTGEAEPIQEQCRSYNLNLRHASDLEAYTRHHSDRRTVAVKVDYESVGKKKKKIYRIYNLDITTGNGDLMIFESPFNEGRYSLRPENWKVSYKRE